MTELERSLAALSREVDWPETPQLTLPAELPRRSRRPAKLAVAAALLLLALGAALAVPSARSAILHLFGFGGVTIERVSTLPDARERPLAAILGAPVGPDAAARLLGEPVRLPPGSRNLRLYADGQVVSTVFRAPGAILLSEFRAGAGVPILKKLASGSTRVEWVQVAAGSQGIWIAGADHVFIGPAAPPRLAGNVLIWQRGEITYRLEGHGLTKGRALELARQILD